MSAIEMNDDVATWDLTGHNLQHFDGHENPSKVLKAMTAWLEISKAAPIRINVDLRHNDDEVYDYIGTIEWCGTFTNLL